MVGKRAFNKPISHKRDASEDRDLESGHKHRRFNGFRDAVEYAMDRRITATLKEELRKGVARGEFEHARKSDEEVRNSEHEHRSLETRQLSSVVVVKSHQEQKAPQVLRDTECDFRQLGRGG